MSLPREPRQKMINMMYLVLTALLALNVSSEILNAFKTVNKSLETTNGTVNSSSQNIMASLKDKTTKPETKERADKWYPKASQVQGYSKTVFDYIQGLKNRIITEAGGDPNDPTKKFKEENLDIATRIMVEKGEGKKLFAMLTDYKNNVLKNVDPAIDSAFANTLPVNLEKPASRNKAGATWEGAYFHMVPTVAALTILSKFQNDIKTSENKLIAFCHEQVGKVEVVFDSYAAVIGQSTSYLMPNQELEITAGIGAFSKAAQPVIQIGGSTVAIGADGAAHSTLTAGAVGVHTVPVSITYFNQTTGKKETVQQTIEYTVGTSSAAVQLDKMNVLFIGVENPVSVSGSGNAEDIKVSMRGGGGSISGGKGHYTAIVNQETDECYIDVKTSDGKVTPVRFRVRSIPDPTPRIGASESGDINASTFKSQAGVNAIVKNFFYETQFNVTGFTITGDGSGFDEGIEVQENTGAAWNEARKLISKCRPGSFITIENIRAIGPDRRTRKLTPMIFNLK